jgi:PAS domain-containing protein
LALGSLLDGHYGSCSFTVCLATDITVRLATELSDGLIAAASNFKLTFELEMRARLKDRQYRWFLVQYKPLIDSDGRVVRWYATGTDINDRRPELYKELARPK